MYRHVNQIKFKKFKICIKKNVEGDFIVNQMFKNLHVWL